MRRVAELAALVAGILVGYALAAALAVPSGIDPSGTPGPGPGADRTPPTGSLPTTTSVESTATTTPEKTTYLVWATGGLPRGLGEGLVDMFETVSIVKGDAVEMETEDNGMIPLDALSIDSASHAPFDPHGALAGLVPGTVALGETSARLRDAAVGDMLSFAGVSYQVVAVAPDAVVSAAEVVFSAADASAPPDTERFALVNTDLTRSRFEEEVRALYAGPAPLRIRAEGETPWLRHGDAVLPQVFIKEALGEFSYTGRAGASFVQDPEFVAANIVRVEVPLLGSMRCHQVVAEMLVGAMTQLIEEGLGHLVDPGGFAGCWNPRYIRAATGTSAGVSRHAWGAAVDINAPSNPIGSTGSQDQRLVEVMEAWGFTWGGRWLVPDPMHFEYEAAPG
ncbi:MAG: M15 family metallopeptidase [Acidimicrobiia bacterium]